MAVDISKQGVKGGDPHYDTTNLRGIREERGVVVGVVKANVHGSHMGVIRVFIPSFSTNELDKSQWRSVRYCTPFYSRVESTGPGDNFTDTKVPAGIVTPPPDLGTTVLCVFPEGKNAEGYYFACVPDTFMLQTVPESTISNGSVSGEFNDGQLTAQVNEITDWKAVSRPVDFISQKINIEQGLDQDPVRGLNNSGYMRESPSEMVGISSKGRRITEDGQDFLKVNAAAVRNLDTTDPKILEGLLGPTSRRKGHSIALDDGDSDGNSNQVRLRTSTGHQILMNDTKGVIYVGNSAGTTWIELGNQGTVDVYASDSINFRTRNINFHADENIKFHSKGYTQVVSEKELHLESGDDLVLSSKGDAGVTSKAFSVKASGMMNLSGGAASSIKAGGIMSVSGTLVMLQGPSLGGKAAKPVRPQQKLEVSYNAAQGKFLPDPGKPVKTTVDRLTSHEPSIATHEQKNTPTGYTGGLSGGGGLAGAFAVLGAVASMAPALGTVGTATTFGSGADVGLDAFGGFGESISNVTGNFAMGPIGSNSPQFLSGGSSFDFGSIGESIGSFDLGSFGDTIGDFARDIDFSSITEAVSDFTGGNLDLSSVGDSIAKFGNSITGTNITSTDFPGLDAFGGAGGNVGFTGDFSNISSSLGNITSGLPVDNISFSGIGDFANADFGKLVTDVSGKIVDIAKDYESALPQIQDGFNKLSVLVPGISDKMPTFLTDPNIAGFPITDLISQVDTGFSIGSLDSIDIQGLNAAVVKVVGSNGASNFIDTATKTVGKYGFDVEQLKAGGFVRPEAVFNDQLSLSSVWTGKDGITNLSKFASNIGVQEQLQQTTIARTYQDLVSGGGIISTDGKAEIMGMLTGAATSNVDIVKRVRAGESVTNVLRNTTSIPPSHIDAFSHVESAIKTGGSVSKTITNIVNKKTITGGNETVTSRVDSPYDPYAGTNGGKKKELDNRIAKLEDDRFGLIYDGNNNPQILAQIDSKLRQLYAQRNKL